MLKFIFGLPCSGKSYTCLKLIEELSHNNQETVLIVPEQFSFESEKEVLKKLGDSFALKTTVLSFSRLVDEVARNIGGICARVLSDADKVIFMNKALIISKNDLLLWGKYVHSVKFAKTMLDTIGEFKINAITPNHLKIIASKTEKISLKNKLLDLSVIYENYDLLTKERFIDPSDNLTRLYDNLSKYCYFEGKTVLIDSFKGFTGQQFKILERIISQAKDVYICFTNDIKNINEFDIFTNIRATVERIEKIANKYNVKIEAPLILDSSHYSNKSLEKIERLIAGNKIEQNIDFDNAVTVCKANTVFDEAEFVARTIRKLVRNENYRFRDFVIITRDTEKYSTAIEYACQKMDVPYFSDKRIPLSTFPNAVLCDYAIKALDFSTENIFGFLKSGISVLSTDEISLLENYTYLWNVKGKLWLEEWDMNVRGFVTEQPNADDLKELEKINTLRKKAIKPIIEFKNNFGGNAFDMCKAIVDLFDNCNLKNALKDISLRFKNEDDFYTVDALRQGYDAFLGVLDSLVVCFGEKDISKQDFYEALSLAISLQSIGVIPQNLDEVTFGEADRIRPSRPKVAFIIGANQGVFPRLSDNKGVFANNERKHLIELGLEISDNSIYASIDENFLVYSNLACATDKLYISYSQTTLSGDVLEPSSFVLQIIENINPTLVDEPSLLEPNKNTPETSKALYSEFCRRINASSEAATLKYILGDKAEKIYNLIDNSRLNKSISKENVKKLYGKDLYMSATKLDTFNRCKFSYFCKYGIKAKKIEPADFNVLQRGTIVHYVLERFFSEYKENIKDLSDDKLNNLTDEYINEYLDSIVGFKSVRNAKHEFIIKKISRALKAVIKHLSEEFKQCDFRPVACELEIGGEGIPLEIEYNEGKVIFNGSIDRVDSFDGYVRVIDYKTGSKKFKLPDVLFGLNLQMLLYLYAVTKSQEINPAGILYMPSKRDLNDTGMAMNGLVLADMDVVTAMEKDNKGEFIPSISINKDGSYSKKLTSFASKEEFELIFSYIEKIIKNTGDSISSGNIEVNPVDGRESAACDYCDYKAVCGIENKTVFKVPSLKNYEVFNKMKEAEENGI